MSENRASHAEWMDAFRSVYDRLPAESHDRCPNCGHRELRLVLVGRPTEADVGLGYFWCKHCRWGLRWSRVQIPKGVLVVPAETDQVELDQMIPSFSVVDGP